MFNVGLGNVMCVRMQHVHIRSQLFQSPLKGLHSFLLSRQMNQFLKRHNMLTDCYLSSGVCVCVCVPCVSCPHLRMFITSSRRDGEKREKDGGSEREKLMRMIVLSQPTMSALATVGNKFDSS